MIDNEDSDFWEVSPLGKPADRSPISSLIQKEEKVSQPSRIILEVTENPSQALLNYIKEKKYELNREFPEQDLIKKALKGLLFGVVIVGTLLSVLSIATFAASYQLVISKSAEHARNLLMLGFSHKQVGQVFFFSFVRIFLSIILVSLLTGVISKSLLIEEAARIGITVNKLIAPGSIFLLVIYAIVFVIINKLVIDRSVRDLL